MGFERTVWRAWCWRTALLSGFLALHVSCSLARGSSAGEGSATNVLPDDTDGSTPLAPLSPPLSLPLVPLSRHKRELPALSSAPRRQRSYRASSPGLAAEDAGIRHRATRTNQDAWAYDRPIAADGSPLGPPLPPALPPRHTHNNHHSQSNPAADEPSRHAASQSDPMEPPRPHHSSLSQSNLLNQPFHHSLSQSDPPHHSLIHQSAPAADLDLPPIHHHRTTSLVQSDSSIVVAADMVGVGGGGGGGVGVGGGVATGVLLGAEPQPQALPLQGGDPTSWTLSDFYDYLSPDYSTTEAVYPDTDTDPPEEEEDPPTPDMQDENLLSTTALSNRWAQLPGGGDDGDAGGVGVGVAVGDAAGGKGGGVGGASSLLPGGGVAGAAVDRSGCSRGYVRSNGTCRSPCEVFSNYCYNGGQCYEVEGVGAFCRCNVQEYVWNKGTRCESIITDFQVMCLLVGGASLTMLLLFMIVVFFAKRLHALRQENSRLRRRSKYRPHSEHHDNFSVSTIAEGSQTNVRLVCDSPSNVSYAQHLAYYHNVMAKKNMNRYTWECKTREEPYCPPEEEPAKEEVLVKSPSPEETVVKAPSYPDNLDNMANQEEEEDLEEETEPEPEPEPMGLQNSVPSHHDSTSRLYDDITPEQDGVTIDLELMLPKDAKLHPATSPPLEYDVYLHKMAANNPPSGPQGPPAPPPLLQEPRGRSGPTGGSMSTLAMPQSSQAGGLGSSLLSSINTPTRSLPSLLSDNAAPAKTTQGGACANP